MEKISKISYLKNGISAIKNLLNKTLISPLDAISYERLLTGQCCCG
ncbi:MAG: hypothetical protein RLZ76_380, partial [Bacteroidota bacterium]